MAYIDDIQPAVIVNCSTNQATLVELTASEKQAKVARAAAHELREQEKAAEKAAAYNLLAIWEANPQSSAKVVELLTVLKLLGINPVAVSQAKSG